MSYSRMVVHGRLIGETETHYITETINGTQTWSKAWYRLSVNM